MDIFLKKVAEYGLGMRNATAHSKFISKTRRPSYRRTVESNFESLFSNHYKLYIVDKELFEKNFHFSDLYPALPSFYTTLLILNVNTFNKTLQFIPNILSTYARVIAAEHIRSNEAEYKGKLTQLSLQSIFNNTDPENVLINELLRSINFLAIDVNTALASANAYKEFFASYKKFYELNQK